MVDDIGLQLNFPNTTISLTSPSLALAVVRVNASNFNSMTFAAQDPANLQVQSYYRNNIFLCTIGVPVVVPDGGNYC